MPDFQPPKSISLTQSIKAEAYRLGFHLVGVTSPAPPAHLDTFNRWLAENRHGEMAYLTAKRSLLCRSDPRQILPGCQSILVLGMRYAAPWDYPSPSGSLEPSGKVSSYAWGEDYHEVFPVLMRQLVCFLEEKAGRAVANYWYTDTGPVLERELAQRAGLGWIGKNTCLINPHLGSFFFLAEIFLDLPLELDPPFEADRCGSCRRCLDACPTGCILPDRTLDARRCISYLTIELKGDVPLDLRPYMGEWVFGCDVCQMVCPWNQRFAASQLQMIPTLNPAFTPRPDVPNPVLTNELALTAGAFIRKFKGSPVMRSRRRGYLRNVVVALGNYGDSTAVPALARVLEHELEPEVRLHAAWALAKIGGSDAQSNLSAALSTETDAGVQQAIRAALRESSQGEEA
jgi:epoxyqueuosine reductase